MSKRKTNSPDNDKCHSEENKEVKWYDNIDESALDKWNMSDKIWARDEYN